MYEPPVAPKADTEPLDRSNLQLPTTLGGAVLRVRELFRMAKGEAEVAPGEVAPHGLDRLAAALNGEIPVVLHADSRDEILAALALAKEHGLRAILAGGEEAGRSLFQARGRDPAQPEVYRLLGIAYEELGNTEDRDAARKVYLRLLK